MSSSLRRTICLLLLVILFGVAAVIHAQSGPNIQYYNNTDAYSTSAEVCHIIPQYTGNPSLAVYGVHVSNTSGSTLYVAMFPNTTAQPADTTVIPGGGWVIGPTADVDISAVSAAIPNGASNFLACLSTTQGTFTAATAVGYFWVLYKGTVATPARTSTATATATVMQTPTATATFTATKTPTPSPT